MKRHGVRCLLMGGQACVFYGAAEFSRDVDFVLLAEPDNLKRLQSALDELKAEIIAIPPFDESFFSIAVWQSTFVARPPVLKVFESIS